MKRKNNFIMLSISLFFMIIFLAIPASASLSLTEKVEQTITKASDMFEQGKIKKGHPYKVHISPNLILAFSEENFDRDMEKAFSVLDELMTKNKKRISPKEVANNRNMDTTQKAQNPPKVGTKTTPVKKKNPPSDRISALMRAENHHPKHRKLAANEVPIQYSVFKSYNALHQSREEQEDKTSEADMQMVNRERQLAEEELQQKRARNQQIQLQAMKWQSELDREAAESARKAAAYKAEHSFGAYVKRFFTTVLQTAVGSFTGAFIGNIGSHLADKAVGSLFHLPSDSPAAAGVSAAVNSAASSTSQAVTNVATSTITKSSQKTSLTGSATKAYSWRNKSTQNHNRGIVGIKPYYQPSTRQGRNKNVKHAIKSGTPYLQQYYRPIKKKVKY